MCVRSSDLFDLPGVALVGAGDVVGQGLGAGEVVVGRRRGDDVALAGDLAGEAGDGASHCETAVQSSVLLGGRPTPPLEGP